MTYQHLLVPFDGSDLSFSALKQAANIAKSVGAKLTAVSLVIADPNNPESMNSIAPMLKSYAIGAYEKATHLLEQAKTLCATEFDLEIETLVVEGQINAESIVTVAENTGIDLVVMGSHGYQGFKKLVLGSLAQDVLASTELAVLIVKK